MSPQTGEIHLGSPAEADTPGMSEMVCGSERMAEYWEEVGEAGALGGSSRRVVLVWWSLSNLMIINYEVVWLLVKASTVNPKMGQKTTSNTLIWGILGTSLACPLRRLLQLPFAGRKTPKWRRFSMAMQARGRDADWDLLGLVPWNDILASCLMISVLPLNSCCVWFLMDSDSILVDKRRIEDCLVTAAMRSAMCHEVDDSIHLELAADIFC